MRIKVRIKAQDQDYDDDEFVLDQYIFLVEMEVKPYEDLDYQFDDEYQMPFDESVKISYPALSFKDALKMFIKDLNSGEVIGTESPFSYKFKPSDFMFITITKNKKEIKSLRGNIDDLEEFLRIQTKKHYRLIQKKAQDNKIYSGEKVAQYMKDITPLEENKPTWFASIAEKYNFKLVKIPINELIPKYIGNDIGAMEYIEGMNRRYYGSNFDGWYTDNDEPVDIQEEDLNNPIVIAGGELLDGYSRVAEHIRRNKSYISAYVAIEKE